MDPLSLAGAERRREVEALLVLEALPRVGLRSVWALLHAAGSAGSALDRPALLRALGGAEAVAQARDPAFRRQVAEAVDTALRMAMRVVLHCDDAYPPALRHLADPPPLLFLRGDGELLAHRGVAVVGARKATARARGVAHRLGAAVAGRGTPVVSGLALGVDGAAHRGALEAGGPTVAVLGCGADRAYPPSHRALFREILERGLVVSEFAPGTPVLPHHFPRRNRILAALAHSLVVVEAGARSGALISVDHALDLGVDVWAVPGPIEEPACAGSNALLAEGARPLVSVDGFVADVLGDAPPRPSPVSRGPEGPVLEALVGGGLTADEVARAAGLPAGQTMALLASLELQGRVVRLPGMRFRKAG